MILNSTKTLIILMVMQRVSCEAGTELLNIILKNFIFQND